ncbi:MAG: KamA family radical SAM protein [Bacteroidota bacterium]
MAIGELIDHKKRTEESDNLFDDPPSIKDDHSAIQNINPKTLAFIQEYYPDVSLKEWNSWQWQIQNSFSSVSQLQQFLNLSDDEVLFTNNAYNLPVRITPYYSSLMDSNDSKQAIRRTMVPVVQELTVSPVEIADPLCEHGDSPVNHIVHRYPDRVLFLVTSFCSSYCRYCTRTHMVAKTKKHTVRKNDLDIALDYISNHKEIRDVLLSGGDPLTMSDSRLEYILTRLRKIEHVEIIRIGTKVPVVLPQRITPSLVKMLKKFHPLFISIHFTHPDELTSETRLACNRLADAGIPLGSQSVLLKGINDDPAVYKKLTHELLKVRVRPYYLYQCDLIPGSSHFRTPVEAGLNIIKNLRGHTSGYAVPHYVIDAPGGGGKIPLLPNYCTETKKGELLLTNYEGNTYNFPDHE